ncbi:MAG TPA: tRNA uridine-5-carboxymethylaminomethyl(34) synthesis enzyme MnmG [Firmicutes bacterium]|nr:tRNA uridine-5-carboxymethylaminomethyl(34) synthesis enzyme MnmG [Bacillota bacterium]
MRFFAGGYEVAVVGAGHAGIEAALAAARMGCSTAVFTINLDWVGNMPCNPSIGGTAKGHLVREIDALGGEMGKAADATFLQSRMLNRGKGPAVHSLRAQIDRREYSAYMKRTLERTPGLDIHQAEVTALERQDGRWKLITRLEEEFVARTVILATGTFLQGKIFVGDVSYDGGPDGLFAATGLTGSLRALGVSLRRFKTGTPARVLKSSLDFSRMERQEGETPVVPFSFETGGVLENREVCHMTWTTPETKAVILANLHRSPLYGGKIEGVGPRYCPSIEDKVVRFAEKERHPVFVEPCGLHTDEMYLQGLSSSLPVDVQLAFLRTIPGLEQVKVMRPAYAIEYDCCDPLQLDATLEFLDLPGLYGAGQFNGSSGYEEAGAQGLVAGVNAARKAKGLSAMRLDRASSYIGTLVDDLVTKGCTDPYRMMTSRSEYRLVLRQDNADERLTPVGREMGLVDESRWAHFTSRQEQKREERRRLRETVLPPDPALNELLVSCETTPVTTGVRLEELLRRPQLDYTKLTTVDTGRPPLDPLVREQVEVELKYEGYIRRQESAIQEMRRLESRLLPETIAYDRITGLTREAQEKLNRVRPRSIGQASRISGVSPADISVLLVWLSSGRAQCGAINPDAAEEQERGKEKNGMNGKLGKTGETGEITELKEKGGTR